MFLPISAEITRRPSPPRRGATCCSCSRCAPELAGHGYHRVKLGQRGLNQLETVQRGAGQLAWGASKCPVSDSVRMTDRTHADNGF